jgi:hypothetical protein
VDEDVAREPKLAVTCDATQFISAEFVERPGLDTLDLVADLGAFRFRCSYPPSYASYWCSLVSIRGSKSSRHLTALVQVFPAHPLVAWFPDHASDRSPFCALCASCGQISSSVSFRVFRGYQLWPCRETKCLSEPQTPNPEPAASSGPHAAKPRQVPCPLRVPRGSV